MKTNKILTALPLLALALPIAAQAEEDNSRWYIGGGMGIGKMEPSRENTAPNLGKSTDIAFKGYAGYDINTDFSVEGYYADLGKADVTNSDDIQYQVYGVSGLWYFLNLNGENTEERREFTRKREGLSLFASAGIGKLRTSTNGTKTDEKHSYHVQFGGGAELYWKDGMSFRGEFTTYDEDAHLYSLSLVKRFGSLDGANGNGTGNGNAINTTLIVPAPVPDDADLTDTDGDGIPDIDDQCPNTPRNADVDASGCHFGGVLTGVNFKFNSAELTDQAMIVLDGVAQEMVRYPKVRVEVEAHTDSIGNSNYNLKLSQRRALSVVDYVVTRGVDRHRLIPKGYGSSRPIASNYTEEGRRRNRRVEFTILGK
jgi:outer membrane protein OmpA-like peptidoglycan-associated protein